MYEYSDEERTEIQSRIEDEQYERLNVNQSLFYSLYDLVRIELECLAEINERLERIESKLELD